MPDPPTYPESALKLNYGSTIHFDMDVVECRRSQALSTILCSFLGPISTVSTSNDYNYR